MCCDVGVSLVALCVVMLVSVCVHCLLWGLCHIVCTVCCDVGVILCALCVVTLVSYCVHCLL